MNRSRRPCNQGSLHSVLDVGVVNDKIIKGVKMDKLMNIVTFFGCISTIVFVTGIVIASRSFDKWNEIGSNIAYCGVGGIALYAFALFIIGQYQQ